MRFTRIGDLDVVTRTTGPTHHFLGIVLTSGPGPESPVMERVSISHPEPRIEPFDRENTIYREVVEAVRDANKRFGAHYSLARLRYCADDPPSANVYHRLAQALVERAVSREREDAAALPLNERTLDQLADESFLEYERREAGDVSA